MNAECYKIALYRELLHVVLVLHYSTGGRRIKILMLLVIYEYGFDVDGDCDVYDAPRTPDV